MNAATEIETSEFFAPADIDMVDGLIGQYQTERARIEEVHEFLSGEGFYKAVGYYIEGNREELSGLRYVPAVERMFKMDQALAALNAHYWRHALEMTDVLDFLPAKRREEWFQQIKDMKTPDFDEETVRLNLSELMAQRLDFLAEKVDDIFQALSRTHVTNRPEGFSKRMILAGVTNNSGRYGREETGYINDLRQVISKFQGRDEPGWSATNRVVEIARAYHRGEWLDLDGGALRIRCYKNGNAHLEVHPDMAWRLNQILAHLHPMAIPSQYRERPKRKARVKDVELMERPLPFAVLDVLYNMERARTQSIRTGMGETIPPETDNRHALKVSFSSRDKYAIAEAGQVLTALGGVKRGEVWEFDYPVRDILKTIVCTGRIPDQKSHQFYPTPEWLAQKAVDVAEIKRDHHCLEPSAGTGVLADAIGSVEMLTCVEVSRLHCDILEAKGYEPAEVDFLEWAANPDRHAHGVASLNPGTFDRILMNPPFDQGRWKAHLEAAAGLLAPGGVLVAILPASARGKDLLPGFEVTFPATYDNAFPGVSISTTILKARRAA